MGAAPDPPALISQLALEGKAAICDQTLSIFVSVFGAETGNCALNFMSTGGIFIGGSIAAKIVPKMKDPVFMESFLDKGRMEALLKDMPVKIVLNDDCGMIGAARYTLIQKAFRTRNRPPPDRGREVYPRRGRDRVGRVRGRRWIEGKRKASPMAPGCGGVENNFPRAWPFIFFFFPLPVGGGGGFPKILLPKPPRI